MPSDEWQRLQEALRTARTPQEKQAASEAMRRYLAGNRKSSKPTIVTLRRGGGNTNQIPLEDLPQAMMESPQVYDRIKKIIAKEK